MYQLDLFSCFHFSFETQDIHNNVTGDAWRVIGKLDMDPFEIANLLIQEDMVIMEQVDTRAENK